MNDARNRVLDLIQKKRMEKQSTTRGKEEKEKKERGRERDLLECRGNGDNLLNGGAQPINRGVSENRNKRKEG
jgi:hypothetical protein